MADPENRRLYIRWLTRTPEKAELIFFKATTADDPPSDDHCVICHERYDTPNEDGNPPEYIVRFPCGHGVGNVCVQEWLEGTSSKQRCIFCNKPMIPARYLQEHVNEIWKMVNEMSPEGLYEELCAKSTRGPLTRSMERLEEYLIKAPSLKGHTPHNTRLVPTFEWLLGATAEFLGAVGRYARLNVEPNCLNVNFEALWRRANEFERTYKGFQSEVREMAQRIKEAESENAP